MTSNTSPMTWNSTAELLQKLRLHSIPVQTQSRLLCFPSEVRNRIMEHVLTSDEPLDYVHHLESVADRTFFMDGSIKQLAFGDPWYFAHEFNQVKYVSKQLYIETAALEYKINPVRFQGEICLCSDPNIDLDVGPAALFSRCIKKSPLFKDTIFLKHVILEVTTNHDSLVHNIETPIHFQGVVNFCRGNPAVQVEYVLNDPDWQPLFPQLTANNAENAISFLMTGVKLSFWFHGKDLRFLVPNQPADDFFGQPLSAIRPTPLIVANLRCRIKLSSSLHHVQWSMWYLANWRRYSAQLCAQHQRYVEDWLKNGI